MPSAKYVLLTFSFLLLLLSIYLVFLKHAGTHLHNSGKEVQRWRLCTGADIFVLERMFLPDLEGK